MKHPHLRYAGYVARHKWFVLVAGRKTGAPLWRLVIHDWSKLTRHRYLSTACLHEAHELCRRACKWCGEPCLCECHGGLPWAAA